MSEGLITRIGKWIDRKWKAKATYEELIQQDHVCSARHIGALGAISEIGSKVLVTPKEFNDLKERLGHLEVYVGMKRVVDPTKQPVAKSAFAM